MVGKQRRVRLNVDVDLDRKQVIKATASLRGQTISDWVLHLINQELDRERKRRSPRKCRVPS